ncbi:MAG: hypothetical protein HY094_09950 [Candidatus Melainabacteria bacterium]|nr:hypothetical protein [Candidatus Melainabacteria bacterium]
MPTIKKNLILALFLSITFILTSNNFAVSSQLTCSGSLINCPTFDYNVKCPTRSDGSPYVPGCDTGVPCCEEVSLSSFTLVCVPSITPTCECDLLALSRHCSPLGLNFDLDTCSCKPFVLPAPTYTCNPGFISCPDNMTQGSCCSVTVGCCPSNPTQCKCPNSNQCLPNCTAPAPTPLPPITYTCDPGYTICPNSTNPVTCCLYGCCPSASTECLCSSNNNQCGPNCSISTPSGGSSTNNSPVNTSPVSNNSNPQIEITGINNINPFAGLKRYAIDLTVTSTNFDSRTKCSLYPRISGLGIRTRPNNFFLGPSNTSKLVKAIIPISRNLKKLGTLTFKANCDNGATAQKDITITAPASQPSTGNGSPPGNNNGVNPSSTGNSSPPSNNSGVSPSQVVISVSGVPSGTTGLAVPVTVDTSVIKLGPAISGVSNAFAITGAKSEGVGIISTGNSLPSSFTITVPLTGVMPGSSTFSIGVVVDMLGGSIITGASATANASSVIVH